MEIKSCSLSGRIGNWTAQYIAMRTMGWPDAFLETDAGVKHALPDHTPRQILEMAERWRPWRSYAVINLWFRGNKASYTKFAPLGCGCPALLQLWGKVWDSFHGGSY